MNRHRFRHLLRLYPRDFLDRWERDLLAFLEEEWAEAAARGGRLWRLRFWARAALDAAAAALRLRARWPGTGRRTRRNRMRAVWTEFGLAWRGFARAPGFHLFGALTVALGVGAVTAVFGVVDGVVLRPLPYPAAARLVQIASELELNARDTGPMSHGAVAAIGSRARSFEAVTLLSVHGRVRHVEGGSELARVAGTGPGVFDLLGARPALGRLFIDADHEPGAAPVAVLSWNTWATGFGQDPGVLGRVVRIDDITYEVVGVLSRSFVPPEAAEATDVEYWTNVAIDSTAVGMLGAFSLGRLREGVTAAQAEAEASAIVRELYAVDGMANFVTGAHVIGLKEATIGSIGDPLWLMLGGVGLLLVIACANVANLMLARGNDRRADAVLRVVLGASRWRIAVQHLAQALVVAVAGGIGGAVIAAGALALLRRFTPGGIPRLAEISLDARVLGFTVALTIVAGLLFGLLPALHACRRAPADLLREFGRTTTARGTRGALVTLETAMAVVLVLVSGLLVNGFLRLRSVDVGYDPEGLAALGVELRGRDDDALRAYFDRLLAAVRALPGVRSAALSAFTPFRGYAFVRPYTIETASDAGPVFLPSVTTSDDWLETMGLRLVAGRDFLPGERSADAPVVLVSDALARASWPGEADVIGRRLKAGTSDNEKAPWYTVVGVVSDVRNQSDDEPARIVYHLDTDLGSGLHILMRLDAEPAAVLPALRRVAANVDPTVPIRTLSTVESLAAESISEPRFYTILTAGFGFVALILALVGIYGTTVFATSRRTREIGVRLALGSPPAALARTLVREGLRYSILGVVLGLACALAGGRLLESYLFGVRSTDPPTFLLTAIAVLGTASLAAYLPARRAIRRGPMIALLADSPGRPR